MSSFSTPGSRAGWRNAKAVLFGTEGSALLEFAITLPLLVVFVVGIFDFSGAFNQKQKIEQAAQEGAIVAGAQPMTDLAPASSNSPAAGPDSLQPVVAAIFNSLASSGVLPLANQSPCSLSPTFPSATQNALTWTYQISGCAPNPFSSDVLNITINRGYVLSTGPPAAVGSQVTITYPYHWRFNSVIQLLVPGASYAPITDLTESATVHNQM